MSITTDAFRKCLAPLRTNVDTVGLLTVCDAVVPEIDELETIFKDGSGYRVMEAWWIHDLELKACRAKQYSWYDFFMGQRVDMSKKLNSQRVNSALIRIAPFILAQRKQPINNNYWRVTGGTISDGRVDSNTTSGGFTANTHWQMVLTSDTGIPPDVNWFNPQERLFVKSIGPGGVISNTAWKIVSSAVVGSTVVVTVLPQNSGSYLNTTTYDLTAPPAGLANPVTGLAVRGTARISSFESFCSFPPGLINTTEDEFWVEETRDAFISDDQYEEWRNLLMDQNPLFANLYDLPLQEYNAQTGQDFQRRLVHNFLYNKPISANQTLSTIQDLDNITVTNWSSLNPPYTSNTWSAATGTYCVGKAAHAVGIKEQMIQMNRVYQAQGAPLNIPALARAIYNMARIREGTNQPASQIFEIVMPSKFFPKFNVAMLEYYKLQSGGLLQLHQDITKEVKRAPLGFVYQDYPLVWPAGVALRVVHNLRAIDDESNAATAAGVGAAGMQLWIKDWSQVKIGVFGSKQVRHETGDLNVISQHSTTAACTIDSHKRHTRLTGMGYTVIDGCPQGDLLIEGFADELPSNTETDPVTDYGPACTIPA